MSGKITSNYKVVTGNKSRSYLSTKTLTPEMFRKFYSDVVEWSGKVKYVSGITNLKYIVGSGDNSLIVYNPDTSDKFFCTFYFMLFYSFTVYNPDTSGKFYCTVYFSLFHVSGTKNLKYLAGTGENCFTVYNPDTSGNFYCTVYFSLLYVSGTKNLK